MDAGHAYCSVPLQCWRASCAGCDRRLTRCSRFAGLTTGSKWQTTTTREEVVAGDKATLTETVRSISAINDIRLAGAWVANDFIQLGIAGHVFTGQNRLLFSQTFPDSLRFIPVSQVSNLDYTGSAVSGGVVIRPTSVFSLALSGRKGLDLNARTGDIRLRKYYPQETFDLGTLGGHSL